MQGSCLCGAVAFDIQTDTINAYQCHCSLCRKQSGTASNLATIIENDSFRWLTDTSPIKTWQKDTGFTSSFCGLCGSPVPNQLRDLPYTWVPVGCLESQSINKQVNSVQGDDEPIAIVAHLCVQSKASWDKLTDITQYPALPDLPAFIQSLTMTDGETEHKQAATHNGDDT